MLFVRNDSFVGEQKMPDDAKPMQRFTRDMIEAFMARCLAATGMPDADAATVAHLMAEADMLGKDSTASSGCPAISDA